MRLEKFQKLTEAQLKINDQYFIVIYVKNVGEVAQLGSAGV